VVFLVGDRAVKLKKPVDLGFLDFRDPAVRRACCRREVDLNRRLAPDVYLGVAEFGGRDRTNTEPLVLMRRMPDRRRLSTLVRQGSPVADDVARIARTVAAFHGAAARSPTVSKEGTRTAIEGRWAASLAQVAPLAAGTLGHRRFDEITELVREFLAGRDALFARRIDTGRIVDGHGDLIADDIFCLDDGPRILDCLDFDDRLRFVDGLDDICFLAMDLERLGAPELGRRLVRHYADLAGDPAPASLRHHFIAYRAFVRSKVGCLRNAQGDPTGAGESVEYADISIRHLRAGVVRMLLVGGLPGSGKSTLAGLAADRLGAVVQATDRLRKEQGGVPPRSTAAAPYRSGLYDPAHTDRAYAELLRRAEQLLGQGESVVLDASWTDRRWRAHATRIADRVSARLSQVECWAPPDLRRTRLETRPAGLSDADVSIADRMARDADPWPAAIRLTTTGPPAQTLDELLLGIGIGIEQVDGHDRSGTGNRDDR
jgi:aminoglycoside phosphotransferase family enzyme/predicted kinase